MKIKMSELKRMILEFIVQETDDKKPFSSDKPTFQKEWDRYTNEGRMKILMAGGYPKDMASRLSARSWESIGAKAQNDFKNSVLSHMLKNGWRAYLKK